VLTTLKEGRDKFLEAVAEYWNMYCANLYQVLHG
jgi:hypothetical protein